MYKDFLKDAITFVGVFDLGSISAYSIFSGEHRVTISKQLERIQYKSGKLLYTNFKSSIDLTEEGKSFFISMKALINDMNHKYNTLFNDNKYSKKLNILTSIDQADFFLNKVITNKQLQTLNLSVNIKSLTQYQIKFFNRILREGVKVIDICSIWEDALGLVDDLNWKIKKVFNTKKNIYASDKYISNHQNIVSDISDINKHKFILNNYESNLLEILDRKGNKSAIKVENNFALDTFRQQADLISKGLGIGLLPDSIFKARPLNLKRIFTEYSTKERRTYILINKLTIERKPGLEKIIDNLIKDIDELDLWI